MKLKAPKSPAPPVRGAPVQTVRELRLLLSTVRQSLPVVVIVGEHFTGWENAIVDVREGVDDDGEPSLLLAVEDRAEYL